MSVRVRFAPSPTGPLHMGGVRTALYNYLFAKKNGGSFFLRIEDTDQKRFVPGAEDYIRESLEWCGISPDESPWNPGEVGPYRQSERYEKYKGYAMQLIEAGHAYYAFDTAEELEAMRERMKAAGVPSPQYNAVTRQHMKNSLTLSQDEVQTRLDNGDPFVIRLKAPRNEEIKLNDMIRGWVVVNSANIDDKVLFKSDGLPTYHLANIVDDHLMGVTHVIRGEEWLPSAPLHVLLYRYLGWEDVMPQFAHLPLILKPDGNGKLSKRDGDRLGFPVFPLEWKDPSSGDISSGYREKGYFPEAFINMLVMLGWNPGTERELFTLEELVAEFDIARVGKAGARFDADKAKWFNQQYLRATDDATLAKLLIPVLEGKGLSYNPNNLEKVVGLMKERASFIEEMASQTFYFEAPTSFDAKTTKKKWKENTPALVTEIRNQLAELSTWDAAAVEGVIKGYMEANELGFGAVLPPLRLVVTGLGSGPGLPDICEIIGKEETLSRIDKGIEALA